jgi:phage/plasmid-like protein (TIGR03299 family)
MHNLEINGQVASFAFAGARTDIWHRLGQALGGESLMTAAEAMSLANMDRDLVVVQPSAPDGAEWGINPPNFLVLKGKIGVTADGELFEIADKVVGITGDSGARGHSSLTMLDRFLLAEEAIRASRGEAVWTTAGLLRNATQGFATMEAPPTIIDPNGVADVVRNYMTVTWSFDGSRQTELGVSNIRVVCANTLAMHDGTKQNLIKVKHTAGAYDRMRLAAEHWAMAQNETQALMLQGERMLAVANGRQLLKKLGEDVLGFKVEADTPKRAATIRTNKMEELVRLYHAPTNMPAVGDNGYAAYQTVVEYLDWFSPVKGEDSTAGLLANQFDGTYDAVKQRAAELVLA